MLPMNLSQREDVYLAARCKNAAFFPLFCRSSFCFRLVPQQYHFSRLSLIFPQYAANLSQPGEKNPNMKFCHKYRIFPGEKPQPFAPSPVAFSLSTKTWTQHRPRSNGVTNTTFGIYLYKNDFQLGFLTAYICRRDIVAQIL